MTGIRSTNSWPTLNPVPTQHLPGSLRADNDGELILTREASDGFRRACGVLIYEQDNPAMEWLWTEALRNHHNGFVREGEAEHEPVELHLARWNLAKPFQFFFVVASFGAFLAQAVPDGQFVRCHVPRQNLIVPKNSLISLFSSRPSE